MKNLCWTRPSGKARKRRRKKWPSRLKRRRPQENQSKNPFPPNTKRKKPRLLKRGFLLACRLLIPGNFKRSQFPDVAVAANKRIVEEAGVAATRDVAVFVGCRTLHHPFHFRRVPVNDCAPRLRAPPFLVS